MNFSQWLAANSYDEAGLSDSQRKHLEAAWKAETAPPAPAPDPDPAPAPAPSAVEADEAEYRHRMATQRRRVDQIGKICKDYDNPQIEVSQNGEKFKVSLEEHAIESNWDSQRTELEALRLSRAKVHVSARNPQRQSMTAELVEAAMCQTVGLPDIDKHFKAETLDLARKTFRGGVGLQQLLLMAAGENGYSAHPGQRINTSNVREVMRYAFGQNGNGGQMMAGFSTVGLSGILGNIANKELLIGYMQDSQEWREIAQIKTVANFQQHTSYRMLDSSEYEELGPGGEIKHGTLDQESYTRQAKTYAKMFALTREAIINDDLGAFDDLRARIGRGAAQKFSNLFWTNMMANHATFFTAARGNYITGATTTLLTDGIGMETAVKAFRQMKSGAADGSKRIGGIPAIVLVPPELEWAADQLFMGEKLNIGSAAGETNVYRGKYRPVVVPWLSDPAFTGNSTTAWYLLREPGLSPMMVVSFLNGMEAPTVESAEADFDTLGIQFRGYHDFGCDQAEYLCGVKSKGAA